jgi:hypothetical protein
VRPKSLLQHDCSARCAGAAVYSTCNLIWLVQPRHQKQKYVQFQALERLQRKSSKIRMQQLFIRHFCSSVRICPSYRCPNSPKKKCDHIFASFLSCLLQVHWFLPSPKGLDSIRLQHRLISWDFSSFVGHQQLLDWSTTQSWLGNTNRSIQTTVDTYAWTTSHAVSLCLSERNTMAPPYNDTTTGFNEENSSKPCK